MLRPPQTPCYFFVLDVSKTALDSGYLHIFSEQLLVSLDQLPGGDSILVGFIGVNSAIHYFQFVEGELLPRHLVSQDSDDPFLPVYDGIIVNLKAHKNAVRAFVQNLPVLFGDDSSDDSNCLGSALQMAYALTNENGARITVMQGRMPNVGHGSLKSREGGKKTQNFGPTTDFYKSLALESVGKHVSFDLFVITRSGVDIATLCKFLFLLNVLIICFFSRNVQV